MKLTIQTPKGDIEVIPATDPIYPGVYVEISGVQVALIEFDRIDNQHAVRVWDGVQEDYVYKQVIKSPIDAGETDYVKRTLDDVRLQLENQNLELSDEQALKIARRVADKYDWSHYNEYISETIENVLEDK